MPLSKQVTAVFDIGKSNKKFLLFDDNYHVLERFEAKTPQTVDDDGDTCEDLEKIESWIMERVDETRKRYEIKSLNVSAYGATLVHLDPKGNPVTPLYNYLKKYPEDLLDEFYNSVGDKETFSLETASPPMGMLNSGLQLYWLKHKKPELIKKVESTLHLPNYLSFLFTGEERSELTSIGCHTAMWDFEKMGYHDWLADEGIVDLLPSPEPVTDTIQTRDDIRTGPGIHDSSAALAPYLIGMPEPFILVSTGTWSITFNPFNDEPLTYHELERDCLCYMDISGNQVKASRLFLGAEYSHQKKRIEDHFGVTINHNEIELNPTKIHKRMEKGYSEEKLQLEQAFNSGPFPKEGPGKWNVSRFKSPEDAYHQMMLDLGAIQREAIRLAEGSEPVKKLIITGGFSQNRFFASLMASLFPDKEVYTSSLPDASALGAAMVVNENVRYTGLEVSHKSRTGKTSDAPDLRLHSAGISSGSERKRKKLKELLGLRRVESVNGVNIKNYSWAD